MGKPLDFHRFLFYGKIHITREEKKEINILIYRIVKRHALYNWHLFDENAISCLVLLFILEIIYECCESAVVEIV